MMSFEILEINGLDISGVSQHQVSRMLQNDSDSFTVKLRRAASNKKTENRFYFVQNSNFQDTSSSTQNIRHSCSYEQLLKSNGFNLNSKQADGNFSEINECKPRTKREIFQNRENEKIIPDNQLQLKYERVTLERPKNDQKLGITLCDDVNLVTNEVKVIVADVAPSSPAAKFKIQPDDVIVKIDDCPVHSMEEAAKLLEKRSSSFTFLIGRPQFQITDNSCQSIMRSCSLNPIDVTGDVTGPSPKNKMTSQSHYDITCKSIASSQSTPNFVAESHPGQHLRVPSYNRSYSLMDNNARHRQENSQQNSTQDRIRRSSDGDSPPFTDANTQQEVAETTDFVYSKPKKFSFAKRVSFSKESPKTKNGQEEVIQGFLIDERQKEVETLNENLNHLHLGQKRRVLTSTSTIGDLEDWVAGVGSPWVQIARRDYETKLRQLEKDKNRNEMNQETSLTKKNVSSPSLPSDNTSSAYSTGESFRSSSSNGEAANIPGGLASSFRSIPTNFSEHLLGDRNLSYTSSDANSDAEELACYMSHLEGSESEGFEDAQIEFSPFFKPNSTSSNKPTPFPRILYPRQESVEDFKFYPSFSQTASDSNSSGTQGSNGGKNFSPRNLPENKIVSLIISNEFENKAEKLKSLRESERKTANFIVPSIKVLNCEEGSDGNSSSLRINDSENQKLLRADRLQFRRKSEHALPVRRPFPTQRSISCVESREIRTDNPDTSENVSMEWKVRIRKDGSRYITKRPVRNQALRLREKRILVDRSAPTSDDEQTEVKLGRHWSRDDRKRQFRVAREKKRRRDFMQQRRLEALSENVAADEKVVELCHKKMSKHKQKRMLFDNFVTVQELVAHGNRASDIARENPLLSVTYI